MPAVPYPAGRYPAVPLTPLHDGAGRTEAPDVNASADAGPADAGRGDPRVVSGPPACAAPSAAAGPIGPGYHTPRFTAPSSPNRRHGIRPLQDARQFHYDPPGVFGDNPGLLVSPAAPKAIGPAAESTPPVTLATVERGLKPWASSMPLPAGPG